MQLGLQKKRVNKKKLKLYIKKEILKMKNFLWSWMKELV